jgi:hypothetical protein
VENVAHPPRIREYFGENSEPARSWGLRDYGIRSLRGKLDSSQSQKNKQLFGVVLLFAELSANMLLLKHETSTDKRSGRRDGTLQQGDTPRPAAPRRDWSKVETQEGTILTSYSQFEEPNQSTPYHSPYVHYINAAVPQLP